MGAVKRVKNVEWEKNRRDRLNLTFLELGRLLPDHDPTLTLTKVEILNKAISYIKELQERKVSLIGTKCNDDGLEAEMTSLREQVKELHRRNQQLAELLHTAKISLPPRPLRHATLMTCPRKWEGKLSSDAVTGLKNVSETKMVEMKENPSKTIEQKKISIKKKHIKGKKNTKTLFAKHYKRSESEKSALNSLSNPLRELNNVVSVQIVSSQPEALNSTSNPSMIKNWSKVENVLPSSQTTGKVAVCSVKSTAVSKALTNVQNPSDPSVQSTLVLSRTVTLPGTAISIVLSNAKSSIVTMAKSNVLPTPIMATGIQPVVQCNPTFNSLGPGTLIMPGGRIVPVPPPPTILAPTLILLPPTTTVSVTTTTTTRPAHKQQPTLGGLRPIVPKPRHKDITNTTFVNKVPIPAISTHRHRLCSVPNTSQNNHSLYLDAKSDLRKKSVNNKLNTREKCSLEISKALIDKTLVSHSNKESIVDLGKPFSEGKVSENTNVFSESKCKRLLAKRKSKTINENTTCSKIAKVDSILDGNIKSSVDSKKSSYNCNSLKDVQELYQKCSGDLSLVHGIKGNKESESNLKPKDSDHQAGGKSCSVNPESNKNKDKAELVINAENTLHYPKMAVKIGNEMKNEGTINKKKDIVVESVSNISVSSISENQQIQNSNVNSHNTETNIVEDLFVNNIEKDSSPKSKEGDYLIADDGSIIEQRSRLIASNTLSKEGLNLNNVEQQTLLASSHDSVTRENNDAEKTAQIKSMDYKKINKNQNAKNPCNNKIVCTDGEHLPQIDLKGDAKQVENLDFNDANINDKNQQAENASLSISNPVNNVIDSSTQIDTELGVKKCDISNQMSSHCSNKAALVIQTSIIDSSTPDENIQVSNNSQNNIFGNQTNPDKSLNLGVKENVISQSNEKDNKSNSDKVTVTGILSDETCKLLNSVENDQCQGPSCSRNTFSSSVQQHSNIVYTSIRSETQKQSTLNKSNGATYSNSVRNPVMQSGTNPENNLFNSQQTSQDSCLESVPPKNSSIFYSERCRIERTEQSSSNKIISIPKNQTNMSIKSHILNSANNVEIIPDVHGETKHSGNFYTNRNYQPQTNKNLHLRGTKLNLQSTIPVSENFSFKTHPSLNVSVNSNENCSNSSTSQMYFINTPNQSSLSNTSINATQKVIKSPFEFNSQENNITETINSNNSVHALNSDIDLKANQNRVNISVDATNSTNCQNQQQILKKSDHSSKPLGATTKTLVAQSCKSTQVTSMQISFSSNEKHIEEIKQAKRNTINSGPKKAADELKSICDKSLVQDDSQELTSLFSTERLQSCSENLFRDACTELRDRNLFMPVSHSYMEEIRLNLPHSDLSNDLLSSLQVPNTGQHPESISPTAAFLLAFPLVSTSKSSELITENEGNDSQHTTPTTILQIGNIETTSNELFHQSALMVENNQNVIKQSKHSDTNKNNKLKQLKDVENFNKIQEIEINELMRNQNFSRNNCKEKKNCVEIGEQDLFYPCTKKKSNVKTNNYLLPSTVPNIQEKVFEFSENIAGNNPEQNRQINHNEKKIQNQIQESGNTSHNGYNSSLQPYSYSSFSSGNEFILPQANYVSSSNQQGTDNLKSSSLSSSNFNVISWTSASITSSISQMDYTAPYCSYPQKSYSNSNQAKIQKNLPPNFEDQRGKEKSVSNINPLPKFANFQLNNSHINQDLVGYPHSNQNDNTSYKPEPKTKKQKTITQRAPVNWMTTPDVRPLLPDASVAPVIPDVMFQHQKELDFASAPNNIAVLNSSSNINPFNISTSASNNSQTYYSNSHFSGVDLQLDFASFPDITTSKQSRTSTNVSNNQQNPHHYLWSPSKSSIPMLPHIDSHMIPSTLPTLVGDLALGTTTPSGPVDTFKNISMPSTPFNIEMPLKKFEKKLETQKPAIKTNEKDCFPNPERMNNRAVSHYCQKTHTHQSTNTSSSFLSVSQLVDHVKSEQSPSLRRTTKTSVTKSNNAHKRSTSNQHTDKLKTSNNINSSYHNSNPGMMGHRKFDTGVYQEVHNPAVGFTGAYGNQGGPMPWQREKSHRSTTHYKGSYSAESLIGEQTTSVPGQISELPQFANQYSHPPVVSSTSYPSADFLHQNVQPLEFNQTHQNSFNFPTNSHYSSAPFNPDGDYHLGMDHLFNVDPTSNKHSTSCQTSLKDNRNSAKRGQNKQRREEFTPQWTPQVYSPTIRPKGPVSLHCPPSTSSPSHQGTTTLTNFNLSTIFPEINDKVGMTGPTPSNFTSATNFRTH